MSKLNFDFSGRSEIDYLLNLYELGDKADADGLRISLTYIDEKKRIDFTRQSIIDKIFYCKKYSSELNKYKENHRGEACKE
ncbi:MAG TPA: hypothetical protein VKG26_13675 [Bacteroidia bacterium]|nr:hypothetical protein [Bacteroidia bacterium]